MKKIAVLSVPVVMMLLLGSIVPLMTFEFENEIVSGSDHNSVEYYGNDWIGISSPEELAKIGVDDEYPLNGYYFLMNDIGFKDIDTNGGTEIEIAVEFSGDELTITLSFDEDITSLYAWVGMSFESVTSSKTIVLSDLSEDTFILSVGGTFDSGSKTFAYSIVIDTHSSLGKEIRSKTFAYSIVIDTTSDNVYYDTFNSNGNFTPIGTGSDPFTGIFDGNGYTIKGLNAVVFSGSDAYAGVFGYTSGATISNLGLIDSSILSISATSSAYVGGMVGYADSSEITNSYNAGAVIASVIEATYVGGVVGYADSSIISKSYNKGGVVGISSAYDQSTSTVHAGGVVGYADSSTVTDCYNIGKVDLTSTLLAARVGGVVGSSDSSEIIKCYNAKKVSVTSSKSSVSAGGIVGYVFTSTTIIDCYNTGSLITSTTVRNPFAGGIVGMVEKNTTITNCYNTGLVVGSATSANAFAGGIAGTTTSSTIEITNCYFLDGMVWENGSQMDIISGMYQDAIIDGNDGRTGQSSGARSGTDLKSESTYYTDPTTVNGETVDGWNFNDVWVIIPEINCGYPILRSLIGFFEIQPSDAYVNSSESMMATFDSSVLISYANEVAVNVHLEFQWEIFINGEWEKITDATDPEYTTSVTVNDNGTMFRVSATSDDGYQFYSQQATLYIVHTITLSIEGEEGGHFTYSNDGEVFYPLNGSSIDVYHGDKLIIKPYPNDGYQFKWSDGTDGIFVIDSVEGSQTVIGAFTSKMYTVTVVKNYGGTVETDKAEYNGGEEVTVTISVNEGYELMMVTVNGSLVALNDDYNNGVFVFKFIITKNSTVNVQFSQTDMSGYKLIAIEGSDGGSVTWSYYDGDASVIRSGNGYAPIDAVVTIYAESDAEHAFVHWLIKGEVKGIYPVYEYDGTDDISIKAVFVSLDETVLIDIDIAGTGKVYVSFGYTEYEYKGPFRVSKNSDVSFSASGEGAWEFAYWIVNEEIIEDPVIGLTNYREDTTFFVRFMNKDPNNGDSKYISIDVYSTPGSDTNTVEWSYTDNGVTITKTGNGYAPKNATITFVANAGDEYTFTFWSGGYGTVSKMIYTSTEDISLTAYFALSSDLLSVNVEIEGNGKIDLYINDVFVGTYRSDFTLKTSALWSVDMNASSSGLWKFSQWLFNGEEDDSMLTTGVQFQTGAGYLLADGDVITAVFIDTLNSGADGWSLFLLFLIILIPLVAALSHRYYVKRTTISE